MARIFIFFGALNGLLAVILGAYAAHGLSHRLSEKMVGVFQTGVDYQGTHALALLATGFLILHLPKSNWAPIGGWLFLIGIILFSGSLYALSVTGYSKLGIITPFGGGTLLLGWFALAISAIRDMPGTH